MNRYIPICLLLVLMVPDPAFTQTLGQLTTAAVASEGEGGIFLLAGNDAFRTGVMARFELGRESDLGMQLGFDKETGSNSFGGGLDFKFHLPVGIEEASIDFAIDASLGLLESDDFRRLFFGIGLMISGVVRSSDNIALEPYTSLTILTTHRDWKIDPPPHAEHDFGDRDDTDTDAVFRGGVKVPLSDDYQLLVEVNINGKTTVGAALNVIF